MPSLIVPSAHCSHIDVSENGMFFGAIEIAFVALSTHTKLMGNAFILRNRREVWTASSWFDGSQNRITLITLCLNSINKPRRLRWWFWSHLKWNLCWKNWPIRIRFFQKKSRLGTQLFAKKNGQVGGSMKLMISIHFMFAGKKKMFKYYSWSNELAT